MIAPLPDWPAFSVFLVATLAVGASPGPGMMFAVARSVGQGRRAGMAHRQLVLHTAQRTSANSVLQ